jgi:hypothetical protein
MRWTPRRGFDPANKRRVPVRRSTLTGPRQRTVILLQLGHARLRPHH